MPSRVSAVILEALLMATVCRGEGGGRPEGKEHCERGPRRWNVGVEERGQGDGRCKGNLFLFREQ